MSDANSTQDNKPFLELKFQNENGGNLGFNDRQDFFTWLEVEVEFWSWLADVTNVKDDTLVSYARDWRKAFNNLKTSLSNAAGNVEALDKEVVSNQIASLISLGFFHSKSLKAKLLKALYDTKGAHAAYVALAYARRQQFDVTNPENFSIILKYNLMSEGIDAEIPKTLMSAFENNQNRAISKINLLTKEASTIIESISAKQKEVEKDLKVFKRWGNFSWHRLKGATQLRIDGEIEKLHDVKKTYTEFMNLSAPVEYWTLKAQSHQKKSQNTGEILFLYALIATSLFVTGSLEAWRHIKNGNESIAMVALLIFVSTILLWAGRLIVRLYLSDVHLSIDAHQRATMVKTYLALINDNKLDKTERELVLRPLFMPTSDGIVKDDASPVISPSGYFSGKMNA